MLAVEAMHSIGPLQTDDRTFDRRQQQQRQNESEGHGYREVHPGLMVAPDSS